MLKKFPFLVKIASLTTVLIVSFGLSYAYAAWTAPTQAPPGANIAVPLNTGPAAQTKVGKLTLNNGLDVTGGTITVNDIYITKIHKWASQLGGTVVASTKLPLGITYPYTGKQKIYKVPVGVTRVKIQAWGAQGQRDNQSGSEPGGKGGYAEGELAVTPGEALYVNVGGQNGWNGGGGVSYIFGGTGPGGGGASDVRIGTTTLSSRIIVAGGGGVGGFSPSAGGAGGGYIGGTAATYYSGDGTADTGGGGGTQTSGGAGGTYAGGSIYGTGTYGAGGAGGGGGWWGGGRSDFLSGGGGGSSYIGKVSAGITTAGVRAGNGQVTITPF